MNINSTSQVTVITVAMNTVSLTHDISLRTDTKTAFLHSAINSHNLDCTSTKRIHEAMNETADDFK